MNEPDDLALLREYAAQNSESAFTELVSRRVDFVYSAALRQTRNPNLAEEITQAVFILLAQKAGKVSDKEWLRRPRRSEDRRRSVATTNLIGWLFKTTRFTALAQIRAETKRARQKKEFQMQSQLEQMSDDLSRRSEAQVDELWNQMSPLLDEALATLGETDRQAVLLRFFENKSLAEVGEFLGIGEDTARKRISRALEKLHRYFSKRGVSSTTAILAGAISSNSIHAAPLGLAKTISTVAVAKGVTASTSTLTLIKGALKIMAWTKTKTAIVAGAVVLLAAGTTTVAVKEYQKYRAYPWEVSKANFDVFYKAQAQVKIVPTKFPEDEHGFFGADSGRGAMGIAQPVERIIQFAFQTDPLHTIIDTPLPADRYDFLAKLVPPRQPHKVTPVNTNWPAALQAEVKRKFGVIGSWEMRNADVLLLRPTATGIKGFKISHSMPNGMAMQPIFEPGQNGAKAGYSYHEQPVSTLVSLLQNELQMPVVDKTDLTEEYDFSLSWIQPPDKHNLALPKIDELNPIFRDQLGLELVPTNMPIEMLVVEKVK